MTSDKKLQDSLANFRKAVDRLEEALQLPKDRELVVEGTIQRFETVVELVWKTLERGLRYEGAHPRTSREAMKLAFAAGWLTEEIVWQELLDYRNSSSHEYLDDAFVQHYYANIQKFHPAIARLLKLLEERFSD